MPHVFVESNWLFDYAAPAHHQSPAAVGLLERAQQGEFILHVPNCCLGEARNAIHMRCQPRNEANAILGFLAHAESGGHISKEDAAVVRTVLNQYLSRIKHDLNNLDNKLKLLAELPCVRFFGLDDAMLVRATELALSGITLKPYDQAILAGVLVNAERLWHSGERLLAFCETDADLQPWTRTVILRSSYERPTTRHTFGCSKTSHLLRPPDGPGLSNCGCGRSHRSRIGPERMCADLRS